MRLAAEQRDLPQLDDAAIKGIIGLGLPEAIRSLYPHLDDFRLIERFRGAYSDQYLLLEDEPSALFSGVAESLEAFRSRRLSPGGGHWQESTWTAAGVAGVAG